MKSPHDPAALARYAYFRKNDTPEDRLARKAMTESQLIPRNISDKKILAAMASVPRHLFIPEKMRRLAYADSPVPIGGGQTVSQPYIVAFMSESLGIKNADRVLEIGTGAGYQTAILAELSKEVYTIEIVESLGRAAAELLRKMNYANVTAKIGDGYEGWPERAPFDAIIVTAAPLYIPRPLVEQLKVGGRMLVPVGDLRQELILLTKTAEGIGEKSLLPVRFVPMTGKAQE